MAESDTPAWATVLILFLAVGIIFLTVWAVAHAILNPQPRFWVVDKVLVNPQPYEAMGESNGIHVFDPQTSTVWVVHNHRFDHSYKVRGTDFVLFGGRAYALRNSEQGHGVQLLQDANLTLGGGTATDSVTLHTGRYAFHARETANVQVHVTHVTWAFVAGATGTTELKSTATGGWVVEPSSDLTRHAATYSITPAFVSVQAVHAGAITTTPVKAGVANWRVQLKATTAGVSEALVETKDGNGDWQQATLGQLATLLGVEVAGLVGSSAIFVPGDGHETLHLAKQA